DRALLVDPDNLNMRYNFACVLAGYAGDKEGAIKLLQSILPVGTRAVVEAAATDPDLDPIRDDPRFQKLLAAALKRHGLEPAESAQMEVRTTAT
ncbi:MAG TPA: hypothetical protein VF757_01580, partial [Sphingomicrobium sp.]